MASTSSKKNNKEREQRILDAAAGLVVRYGFDKVTVSEIAEEAGVSKGAVYLHWDRKDALYQTLVWREIRRFVDGIIEHVRDEPDGGSFPGFLKAMLIEMDHNEFMRAVYSRDIRVLGRFLTKNTNLFQTRLSIYTEGLTRLQEIGALHADLDPAAAAYISNALSYGILNMDESVPTKPVTQIIDTLGTILERAFAPGNGGNSEAAREILIDMLRRFKELLGPS
jgi:TetR/AcrR family acrAB operon transcriptional repressor